MEALLSRTQEGGGAGIIANYCEANGNEKLKTIKFENKPPLVGKHIRKGVCAETLEQGSFERGVMGKAAVAGRRVGENPCGRTKKKTRGWNGIRGTDVVIQTVKTGPLETTLYMMSNCDKPKPERCV